MIIPYFLPLACNTVYEMSVVIVSYTNLCKSNEHCSILCLGPSVGDLSLKAYCTVPVLHKIMNHHICDLIDQIGKDLSSSKCSSLTEERVAEHCTVKALLLAVGQSILDGPLQTLSSIIKYSASAGRLDPTEDDSTRMERV